MQLKLWSVESVEIKKYIAKNYGSRRQFALDWNKCESSVQNYVKSKKETLVIKYGNQLKVVSVLATKKTKIDQQELDL
jgi:hypothetical protein